MRVLTSFACILLLLCGNALFSQAAYGAAQDHPFRETDWPLPRFASIKSDKAYMRSGPGQIYPVKWVYTQSGYPVEILREYQGWRQIRDKDGEIGWMNRILLTTARTGLATCAPHTIFYRQEEGDSVRAFLSENVIFDIQSCGQQRCEARYVDLRGWIDRKCIWGIYAGERIE